MTKKTETKSSRIGLTLIYIAIIITCIVVAQSLLVNRFAVGETLREDIYSIQEFNNTVREDELKNEAANQVETVYKKAPQAPITVRESITAIFNRLQQLRVDNALSLEGKKDNISKEVGLSEVGAEAAVKLDYKEANYLELILSDLIGQWFAEGVSEDQAKQIGESVSEALEAFDLSANQKVAGRSIVETVMIPNLIVDLTTTELLRQEAMDSINPIMVKRGDLLFAKGHVLEESDLAVLKIAGLVEETNSGYGAKLFFKALGVMVITMTWFLLGSLFMKGYQDKNSLLLIYLLNGTILLLPLFLQGGYLWFLPIMAVTLLITTLIDEKTSLFNIFYLLTMLQYIYPMDGKFIIVFTVFGWLGILLSRNLVQYGRGRMIGQSLIASLVGAGIYIILEYSNGIIGWYLWKPVVAIIANALLSAIIYIGSLPLWENIFHKLTPVRLLELSNPHRPLLRELIETAPGTYQHSILVGNLAEAAAQKIGANALLCRVGAYYHDIGKSKAAYYFKENQLDGKNPHDILSPKDSARVIRNHVIDGQKLGQEAKLPKEIIDMIKEHHGTTLVRYFYYMAMQEGNCDVKDYQYPGPKPQTKESAILMIADSVEAATRSLEYKNEKKVRAMVDKIIKGKMDERQFDECPLSFEEMAMIESSLVESILRVYHDRIAYPEEIEEER